MKRIYQAIENAFEHVANVASTLFSNSIVFILAIALVVYWMSLHNWNTEVVSDDIRDILLAITFLSFFIIQRTMRHFQQVLHIKLNELVAAHEKASNRIVKAEEKTLEELEELSKEHDGVDKEH